MTMSGISRLVWFWCAAASGLVLARMPRSRSRSAPVAVAAVPSKRSTTPALVGSSMLTCGFAARLWYQAGCEGAAIAEAHTKMRPGPSVKYASGVVRARPVLAPVVVSRTRGMLLSLGFVTWPLLARNSWMTERLRDWVSRWAGIGFSREGLACAAGRDH